MARRFFIVIFLLFATFILAVGPAEAQVTCDLCGLCQGQPQPANWSACATCLYGTNNAGATLGGAPPNPDRAFTVFGCVATDAGGFSDFFLRFFTSVVGGLAFLGMVYGGLKVMLARGEPDAIREGKRYLYGSILGLLVVLFSVFIIRMIGGTILNIPYLQ